MSAALRGADEVASIPTRAGPAYHMHSPSVTLQVTNGEHLVTDHLRRATDRVLPVCCGSSVINSPQGGAMKPVQDTSPEPDDDQTKPVSLGERIEAYERRGTADFLAGDYTPLPAPTTPGDD